MAQPSTYNREFSFTNYQAANPLAALPATHVDAELNLVKTTLDQILANLALIQRDDTALANASVGLDQLKAEVSTGIQPPTLWVTAHNYIKNDTVFANNYFLYRCLVSHTSGTFATDLAAGKWLLVASLIEAKIASIAGLTMAADEGIYFSDALTAQQYALTAQGRALSGLAATGIPAITGATTAATRTITGTTSQITITNGDGVAGNPTASFPTAISLAGHTIDQGTFSDTILTGSPTAPTVANTTTNTNIATTAFVKSVRLDQFAAPNTSVSWGSQKITSLADPSSAQDAATKAYVDGVAQGLIVKPSCAVATTANITLSGEQTIDGVLTSASRVLVKNQTLSQNNGIYVSAAGAWTRATDMDTWLEVPQAFSFITGGTVNGATGWFCTSATGGTLNTTAITFSQFSGAGTYLAGTNITLTGSTFSVSNSPSFVTPNVNVAIATSINKMAITAPASGSTLAVADGKTLTASNTLTFAAGSDGTTQTFQGSDTILGRATTDTLTNKTYDTAGTGNVFKINGTTVSSNTGTGANVLATSPTLVTPVLGVATATTLNGLTITANTGNTLNIATNKGLIVSNTLTFAAGSDGTTQTFQGSDTIVGRATTDTLTNKTISGGSAAALTGLAIRSTGAAFDLTFATAEVLTAGRTLSFVVGDAARTISLAGNITTGGALTTSGAFATTLTMTNTTNLTLPTAGTLSTLAGTETLLNKTLTSPTMTAPVLGAATATSINKMAITAPATSSTLAVADGKTFTASNTMTLAAGADSQTFTFPAATDTLMGLATIQTVTAAMSFNSGKFVLKGATSGTTTLNSGGTAGSSVLTLPVATDTLIGKATTDTLTNKTYDTAGSGNSFSINGTAISVVTGTGAVVLADSPALTTNPTAPTQSVGNNSTRIATTAFVTAAVAAATAGVASFNARTGTVTSADADYTFGQIGAGTATNDNATAGRVGEIVVSEVLAGSAVSLTNNTATNVTSISLTAGDWDVTGNVAIAPSSTMTALIAYISTTSATLPTRPGKGAYIELQLAFASASAQTMPAGTIRLSLSGTTTVYLGTFATFASTATAYGYIQARRRR